MHARLSRILGAAILAAGVAFTPVAFAGTQSPAAPPQKAPSAGRGMMGGQGMMNGRNMMGGGANMMGMMSAMTRMANTCNAMMQSATRTPAAGPSHS